MTALRKTVVLAACLGWSVATFPAAAQDAGEISKIAEEAYIFAYPLLYNYKTLYTQTQEAEFPGYIGGFERYRHYSRPYSPQDTDIVTPNNDTTYSWAWLDLRREPVVFETPDLDEGRYNVFQWFDLYTHVFASPGSRVAGEDGRTYLFAGPEWDGETPAGVDEVFKAETDFVGTLTRTSIAGEDDIPAVRAIQHAYRFTPLSEFLGTKAPPPADDIYFPVWREELAQTPAFIGYLNFVLAHVEPNPADAEALKSFKAIGVEPGASFDPGQLAPETAAAIQTGIDAAMKRLTERTAANKDNIGLFGSREYLGMDYEARAVGAMIGIYGQNEKEAVYFSYQADADGNPLDGTKTYELTFASQPEVTEFWSLTMYNLPQRLLVDNPIGRYSIGDRTEGLILDGEGLTINPCRAGPWSGQELAANAGGPILHGDAALWSRRKHHQRRLAASGTKACCGMTVELEKLPWQAGQS